MAFWSLSMSAGRGRSPLGSGRSVCPFTSTRHHPRVPLAHRLCEEERDLPSGPRLVFRVRRKRRDGYIPEPGPLGFVLDLAHPHRLHHRMVANLDGRVHAQVVHPDRVLRCPALRPDKDVVRTVLDAHERGLPDRAGLVAGVGHDDHRQPGVAKRGAFGTAATLVKCDLFTHPIPGAGNILCHGALRDTGEAQESQRLHSLTDGAATQARNAEGVGAIELEETAMVVYAFDVDDTLEVSKGPVKLLDLVKLREHGHIVGLCGNWAMVTLHCPGWHHICSFVGPCGIEKHDFLRQLRQYIPGHDYVMVGNILGISGASDDRGAAERAGWRFIQESEFANGVR